MALKTFLRADILFYSTISGAFIGCGGLLLYANLDDFARGHYAPLAMIVIFVALGLFGALMTHDEYKAYEAEANGTPLPEEITLSEKLVFLRRVLGFGFIIFTAISFRVWCDAAAFEAGEVSRIALPRPLVLVYTIGGFWALVLFTPLLMAGLARVGYVLYVRLKAKYESEVLDVDL